MRVHTQTAKCHMKQAAGQQKVQHLLCLHLDRCLFADTDQQLLTLRQQLTPLRLLSCSAVTAQARQVTGDRSNTASPDMLASMTGVIIVSVGYLRKLGIRYTCFRDLRCLYGNTRVSAVLAADRIEGMSCIVGNNAFVSVPIM